MSIPVNSLQQFAPLFRLERARLLEILQGLREEDWLRPTPCPGWDVLDLAAHLVGVDFSVLSRHRDRHAGPTPPAHVDEAGFIAWLDDLQADWVYAARRLSPRLVADLLDWTNAQIEDLLSGQDPTVVLARVSWASADPVPVWLDQGRELSEQWIHRQQVLEAVDRSSDLRDDLAGPVLDILRWAYPYRLGTCTRPDGSIVEIHVSGEEAQRVWRLRSDGASWAFADVADGAVIARMDLTVEQAWRLLTNNYRPLDHGSIRTTGDEELIETLRDSRAIIGTPK